MTQVKPVPEGYHTLMPYFICAKAAEAMAFYEKAFGAKEAYRTHGPNGGIVNAMMTIGDSRFMLMDENLQWGAKGPLTLGGTAVTLHLCVADVDALYQRALAAGVKVVMPLGDQFWGDRYACVDDPFGHRWSMSTRIKDMTPEEMQQAAKQSMGY